MSGYEGFSAFIGFVLTCMVIWGAKTDKHGACFRVARGLRGYEGIRGLRGYEGIRGLRGYEGIRGLRCATSGGVYILLGVIYYVYI